MVNSIWPPMAKKRGEMGKNSPKMDKKRAKNIKLPNLKLYMILKCPNSIIWYYKLIFTYLSQSNAYFGPYVYSIGLQ